MKQLISRIAAAGSIAYAVTMVGVTQAQVNGFIRYDDCPPNIANATGCEGSFRTLLVSGINWILGFVGIIAITAIIYAGFLYLTSGGDDGQAQQGRTIIQYVIIGIVIILLSYAIVATVIRIFSGDPPQ